MESSSNQSNLGTTILRWVLGSLGITALIKLLPRAMKYLVRRWLFGLVAEIIIVVLAGLLTEKAVEKLSGSRPSSDAPSR